LRKAYILGRLDDIAMNPIPATDPSLAITYRRVSSREQAHAYGLDVQASAVEAFAAREGLKIVGDFSDPGVSGTTPLEQRPGLTAALDMAISAGAGVLIVARHDRLARETLQALLIEQALSSHGVRVLYAEGMNGVGDDAEFMHTVMHAMAQQAKRELVRKLKAGRQAKAREHPASRAEGGRVPFGYRRTATALEIDPEQAAEVKRMFDLIRSGKSLRATAAALSSDDHTWHPTAVERIVKRNIYTRAKPGRIVDGRVFKQAQTALVARRRRRPKQL
jgi:DNA invertase Pin-like site-specific DNA recombinase